MNIKKRHVSHYYWGRNINRLSIVYAFWPRLRAALPPSDEHSRRNLRLLVYRILTCILATHPCILTSVRSTCAHAQASPHTQRSPTDHSPREDPEASDHDFSLLTFSAQDHVRPVSYYALFKWWLLLSQPPGCLRDFTSFHT